VDGLGGYGTLRNLRILAASTSFRRTEMVFPAMHSVLDVSYNRTTAGETARLHGGPVHGNGALDVRGRH
jgi:hypothetical protein